MLIGISWLALRNNKGNVKGTLEKIMSANNRVYILCLPVERSDVTSWLEQMEIPLDQIFFQTGYKEDISVYDFVISERHLGIPKDSSGTLIDWDVISDWVINNDKIGKSRTLLQWIAYFKEHCPKYRVSFGGSIPEQFAKSMKELREKYDFYFVESNFECDSWEVVKQRVKNENEITPLYQQAIAEKEWDLMRA